ncbi:MAG: hypothetical protein OEM38_06690 [Gammaproteobacteria bacterium]|nr:hypothetical protein [Gammaproteobacteria bacterium]
MTKTRLNHTLLFVLITAFLLMQWTTSHIHLAEQQHNHDGNYHQHNNEVHAHHSINDHTDLIDSAHQTNDTNVVELEHKYNAPKIQKQEKPFSDTALIAIQSFSFSQPLSVRIPLNIDAAFGYLERSTVNLRGPPFLS